MELLNRVIIVVLLVFAEHSYSGNSMQLYRRIIRQYGHPPYEQIILKPAYQPIQPHRPYHPIIKFDETPVYSNPYAYHHYDPSFYQQQTLFHPIPKPNLFQPEVVQAINPQPPLSSPQPPPKITHFYPSQHYANPYSEYNVQNPYFHGHPQPIRYTKHKIKPDHKYHNPSHHYIPQPHHHHQSYQEEYHNDEDPPAPPISSDHRAIGKETSTKHVTNTKSVKMMPHREQADEEADEEPLERPDVSKTTGPVFTYVKTDPHANIKWAVRHFVGKKYT